MTYSCLVLDSARDEIDGIVRYLSESSGGAQAANHFLDELERQLRMLAKNPRMRAPSRMRELSSRGYRTFPINNYVGIYKVVDQKVIVAHVFHQSQNYARYV